MGETLEQFFDGYASTRKLKEDLEINMETFGDTLSAEDRENLMRTNMIMIRQCLMDFGRGND